MWKDLDELKSMNCFMLISVGIMRRYYLLIGDIATS